MDGELTGGELCEFRQPRRKRELIAVGAAAAFVLSGYWLLTGSDLVLFSSHVSGVGASIGFACCAAFALALEMFLGLKIVLNRPDVKLTNEELILYWFPTARHIRWSDVVDIGSPTTTRLRFGPAVESVPVRTVRGHTYRVPASGVGLSGDEVRRELMQAWATAP